MSREGDLQPVLVAIPVPDEGLRILLDPAHFHGLDQAGGFLAEVAGHYARAFVQSGRAIDLPDAIEQVGDSLITALEEMMERAVAEAEAEDEAGGEGGIG